MSEEFSPRYEAIKKSTSDEGRTRSFLKALEAVSNWKHIITLCSMHAQIIQLHAEVDEAFLAKVIEVDKSYFGDRKDSLLRRSEFLPGIITGLNPNTKTFQWAQKAIRELIITTPRPIILKLVSNK